jgi:ribosomal protein L29
MPGVNPDPRPAFGGSYSFSAGVPPSGLSHTPSMRKASEEEIEARIQERKAEWTQQERERAHTEAQRSTIRDRVKKQLSRVETFTDVGQILKAFGYGCDAKDVKKGFKMAIIEMHPDKIAQSGTASLEEAVRKEEMFKILMSKKHLL